MANERARNLRTNATDAERHLWRHLRRQQLDGLRFRRQTPIGPHVVDFFSPGAKLIVELDGGQHAERQVEDQARTRWLEQRGYRVVRFWNNEVLANTDGVLDAIKRAAIESPPPSPSRGEGTVWRARSLTACLSGQTFIRYW
jgi:very-short-patch-repair endonuclease